MKALGGFIDLDALHRPSNATENSAVSSALHFAYGRNALLFALSQIKPKALHLPFYICDSVTIPPNQLGIPIKWYSIQHDFTPNLPHVEKDEMLLIVNYFGLLTKQLTAYADIYEHQLIIDNTQAWYDSPNANCWSFNSSRKFFGIPDGAQLFYPKNFTPDVNPELNIPEYRHLIERSLGNEALAHQIFAASESQILCNLATISQFSAQLLDSVPHEIYIQRRKQNFEQLHSLLAPHNTIAHLLVDIPYAPFMYPFVPKHKIKHLDLYALRIFAPILWNDCSHRKVNGFEFEKDLAQNIIPLPLDYRYTTDDMRDLVNRMYHLL